MRNLTDRQLNAISVMVHEGRLCIPMGVSDREFHSWLDSADFKKVLLNNMVIAKLLKLMNSDDEAVVLRACGFVQEQYLNKTTNDTCNLDLILKHDITIH